MLTVSLLYCYSLIAQSHSIEVYDYGNSFENLIIIRTFSLKAKGIISYFLFYQIVQYLYVVKRNPFPLKGVWIKRAYWSKLGLGYSMPRPRYLNINKVNNESAVTIIFRSRYFLRPCLITCVRREEIYFLWLIFQN